MLHAYQKPLNGDVGIVFGSFAPLHQGHLDLIMRAKKENSGGAIVIVCCFDGDKGEPMMPHTKRYRYVREYIISKLCWKNQWTNRCSKWIKEGKVIWNY